MCIFAIFVCLSVYHIPFVHVYSVLVSGHILGTIKTTYIVALIFFHKLHIYLHFDKEGYAAYGG